MEEEHRDVFWDAADIFECWIGVREPNPYSQDYQNFSDAIPKPEECKAKTSDNPECDLRGLVVSPIERPDAFQGGSIQRARDTWNNQFLVDGKVPAGFTVEKGGADHGLVRLNGMKIFADYDLMTLVPSNDRGEYLDADAEDVAALAMQVEHFVNRRLPKPMIQHGPEFLFDGVGAKHGEFVLWFGPGRRFHIGPSSVSKDLPH